jgi:hypothetical protein
MGISTSDVLTLREVALRLGRLPGSSARKIGDAKLLSLLKSGDLPPASFPRGISRCGSQYPRHIGPGSAALDFDQFVYPLIDPAFTR